nr:MAG TPA: resistance protein [Caudoviricetes sp.]
MKLYELAENYNELLALLDNEEATAEELADTLDGINDAIEVKVDNICRVRKYLEGKVEVYNAEAKRLTALAKQAENNADSMKNYLDEQLKRMNIQKMDTELFKLSYRKSDSVNVIDLDAVPDAYKKITIAADKAAIKKAIKEGAEVAGAELVTNKNLQIR